MASHYLTEAPLPFCGGCGHGLVVRNTARALEQLGISSLDVVLVTDIGCHGIIDSHFRTHTVHGLHGRAVALAAGIAASLPNRKVIVYIGDGGAVIGLQHLIEAAHRNFDITVVVHNNMLYGMTGGQPSGLTPCGYRTPVSPDGHRLSGYDLCRRVHTAGAASARRVIGKGDFSEAIAEALGVPGFSLVEVLEHCPSYGVKLNPGRSIEEIAAEAGLGLDRLQNATDAPFRLEPRSDRPSLLDVPTVERRFAARLTRRVSLLLGGSAGEGVQVAAELFARAAVASGLNVTKRGAYPVTVGTGHSVADIILSPEPILYSGAIVPDYVVITSADGLRYFGPTIEQLSTGAVLLDQSLPRPQTGAGLTAADIRASAGARGAAVRGLALLLRQHGIFPIEAFQAEVAGSRLGAKLDIERLFAAPDHQTSPNGSSASRADRPPTDKGGSSDGFQPY